MLNFYVFIVNEVLTSVNYWSTDGWKVPEGHPNGIFGCYRILKKLKQENSKMLTFYDISVTRPNFLL